MTFEVLLVLSVVIYLYTGNNTKAIFAMDDKWKMLEIDFKNLEKINIKNGNEIQI